MIQAGKLNQRITVTPVVVTTQTNGERVESSGTPLQVWANVREQGDAERQRNGITTNDKTYAITIRYRADVDNSTTFGIIYRGRALAVSSNVAGGQSNREWLFITASEAK